jgi:hypothetical protein
MLNVTANSILLDVVGREGQTRRRGMAGNPNLCTSDRPSDRPLRQGMAENPLKSPFCHT